LRKTKLKIGITGGRGIIGTEFREYYKKNFKFIIFKEDICIKKKIDFWIKKYKPEIIIHLAAVVETAKVNRNRKKAKNINYVGTKNLIEVLKKNNLKPWFFFSSSSHVYNFSKKKLIEKSNCNPITYYGKLKLQTEKYLLKNKKNLPICIARIFSFTHHKQNKQYFIPSIYQRILKKKNLNHDSLKKEFRDFLSTKDICRAIKILIDNRYCGLINICSSKSTCLNDIIKFFKGDIKKIKNKQPNLNSKKSFNYLIGNNKKLIKLGFKSQSNINTILRNYKKRK
tara:strand:+ start:2545 stop:3393 length:849 start_codon:yes stop_codon:yes gene_type:complete